MLGLHDETVQMLFTAGLSIQSAAARHVQSARLRGNINDLVAVLDASIRAVQLAAFDVRSSTIATDAPAGAPIGGPGVQPLSARNQPGSTWAGEISWRQSHDLREDLFDQLEVPACSGLRLDVRAVTSIDNTGIAVLVGANHRAAALGRRLVLVDANGPVTASLARLHLIQDFELDQVSTGTSRPALVDGPRHAANDNGAGTHPSVDQATARLMATAHQINTLRS